ncbi:MAG TPA: MEDS domain-containing protein [Gemmatimonadales bacterium]|jgi:transcriptional repressor of dcmA and dcmR
MDESEPLLDIEQAARFLNVSETSLRRWTNDGRLACLRVGRRRERRFRMADLLAFLEGQPAGSSRTAGSMPHGTHLCGLYSSDEGQVGQAVAFFAGGFPPRSVSFLVGTPETRGRILVGLEREYPELAIVVAEGRLVMSDYAPNTSAQLAWWETQIGLAVRRGATQVRAIGDAGAFVSTASSEELAGYEAEFDRRIAGRFPVIAMCQYDVRQFSGLSLLDTLKSHPHSFGQSAERILA